MNKGSKYYILVSVLLYPLLSFSQNANNKLDEVGLNRVITTAVPFLGLSPDARSGALGDAGVAISPDVNSMYWNGAKLAFIEDDRAVSISYNPWLRKLVNDMSLSYLTGVAKLSQQEALGVHLTYFDLGSIQFTDEHGEPLGPPYDPREYSAGVTYSRKLSENSGVSLGLKFIHSNLSGNITTTTGAQTRPGNTAAGDIGYYWRNDIRIGMKDYNLAFGANLSNIGAKISYTNNNQGDYIPTNLKVGAAFTANLDEFNTITLVTDANKLLVPSPPEEGTDPEEVSYIGGMLGSFSDAPGGLSEELKEVILNVGLEYWYHTVSGEKLFAVRGGYFHEAEMKGNRKYFTLGFGLSYEGFGLDFAYLIPVTQNNPLADSLRFTLAYGFNTKKREESITE